MEQATAGKAPPPIQINSGGGIRILNMNMGTSVGANVVPSVPGSAQQGVVGPGPPGKNVGPPRMILSPQIINRPGQPAADDDVEGSDLDSVKLCDSKMRPNITASAEPRCSSSSTGVSSCLSACDDECEEGEIRDDEDDYDSVTVVSKDNGKSFVEVSDNHVEGNNRVAIITDNDLAQSQCKDLADTDAEDDCVLGSQSEVLAERSVPHSPSPDNSFQSNSFPHDPHSPENVGKSQSSNDELSLGQGQDSLEMVEEVRISVVMDKLDKVGSQVPDDQESEEDKRSQEEETTVEDEYSSQGCVQEQQASKKMDAGCDTKPVDKNCDINEDCNGATDVNCNNEMSETVLSSEEEESKKCGDATKSSRSVTPDPENKNTQVPLEHEDKNQSVEENSGLKAPTQTGTDGANQVQLDGESNGQSGREYTRQESESDEVFLPNETESTSANNLESENRTSHNGEADDTRSRIMDVNLADFMFMDDCDEIEEARPPWLIDKEPVPVPVPREEPFSPPKISEELSQSTTLQYLGTPSSEKGGNSLLQLTSASSTFDAQRWGSRNRLNSFSSYSDSQAPSAFQMFTIGQGQQKTHDQTQQSQIAARIPMRPELYSRSQPTSAFVSAANTFSRLSQPNTYGSNSSADMNRMTSTSGDGNPYSSSFRANTSTSSGVITTPNHALNSEYKNSHSQQPQSFTNDPQLHSQFLQYTQNHPIQQQPAQFQGQRSSNSQSEGNSGSVAVSVPQSQIISRPQQPFRIPQESFGRVQSHPRHPSGAQSLHQQHFAAPAPQPYQNHTTPQNRLFAPQSTPHQFRPNSSFTSANGYDDRSKSASHSGSYQSAALVGSTSAHHQHYSHNQPQSAPQPTTFGGSSHMGRGPFNSSNIPVPHNSLGSAGGSFAQHGHIRSSLPHPHQPVIQPMARKSSSCSYETVPTAVRFQESSSAFAGAPQQVYRQVNSYVQGQTSSTSGSQSFQGNTGSYRVANPIQSSCRLQGQGPQQTVPVRPNILSTSNYQRPLYNNNHSTAHPSYPNQSHILRAPAPIQQQTFRFGSEQGTSPGGTVFQKQFYQPSSVINQNQGGNAPAPQQMTSVIASRYPGREAQPLTNNIRPVPSAMQALKHSQYLAHLKTSSVDNHQSVIVGNHSTSVIRPNIIYSGGSVVTTTGSIETSNRSIYSGSGSSGNFMGNQASVIRSSGSAVDSSSGYYSSSSSRGDLTLQSFLSNPSAPFMASSSGSTSSSSNAERSGPRSGYYGSESWESPGVRGAPRGYGDQEEYLMSSYQYSDAMWRNDAPITLQALSGLPPGANHLLVKTENGQFQLVSVRMQSPTAAAPGTPGIPSTAAPPSTSMSIAQQLPSSSPLPNLPPHSGPPMAPPPVSSSLITTTTIPPHPSQQGRIITSSSSNHTSWSSSNNNSLVNNNSISSPLPMIPPSGPHLAPPAGGHPSPLPPPAPSSVIMPPNISASNSQLLSTANNISSSTSSSIYSNAAQAAVVAAQAAYQQRNSQPSQMAGGPLPPLPNSITSGMGQGLNNLPPGASVIRAGAASLPPPPPVIVSVSGSSSVSSSSVVTPTPRPQPPSASQVPNSVSNNASGMGMMMMGGAMSSPHQIHPLHPNAQHLTPSYPSSMIASSNTTANSVSQMSNETAKNKCKNFLSFLLELSAKQNQQVARNVKGLIQGLIDGKVNEENFADRLQKEVNSQPQPCLVGFLKKSLPYLRHSLATNELKIDGIKPPPLSTLVPPAPVSALVAQTPSTTPERKQTPPVRPTTPTVAPSTVRPTPPVNSASPSTSPSPASSASAPSATSASPTSTKSAKSKGSSSKSKSNLARAGALAAAGSNDLSSGTNFLSGPGGSPSIKSSIPSKGSKEKKDKTFLNSGYGGDDDINDVAAMGGVNLAEESQRILGSTEYVGTQIRSCRDETMIQAPPIIAKFKVIASKFGLEETPSSEVSALLSHAVEERIKTMVEKLSVIAEHRMDVIKLDERYEVTQDVKGQLRFLEELDKLEKKRHDEQEREMLIRAAKSRSKSEDPEQAKLKAKAKEMQRVALEEMRQRDANLTALQAIGPRKKPRLDTNLGSQGSVMPSPLGATGASSSLGRPQMSLRPRLKRVNLRDLLFLLEHDKETMRSPFLYKNLLLK